MKTHASAVVCFALLAFVISANAYPRSESVLTENNDEVEDVKDNDSDINIKTVEPVLDGDENSKVSYSGAQLWKVDLNNDVTKYVLGELRDRKEISPWGGTLTSIDILVHPKYQTHVEKVFSQSNITYEISIHDIQRAIDTENPLPNEDDELANRKGHRMTWSAYHRVVDINGYLDYLAITYPSLCTVKTIGSSVEGRQIKVLKVSNGKPGNKAVWIDGGMHAREWISPATVTYIINQFVENYDIETEDVKNLDWYFAPVMNPDGYEYSHTTDRLWRKNRSNKSNQCLGTDLNRNFGYKWGGKGSSKNPCTEIYGGSGPFSEPETTALRDFILNSGANFKSYISFHSYGQYILYPWGYDRVVPPDYSDLKIVAQKAAQAMRNSGGSIYKVGPAANTLYPAAGGSDDWAKGAAKIKYAYTVELGDTGRHGFILPAQFIDSTAKEALAAVRVFGAVALRV